MSGCRSSVSVAHPVLQLDRAHPADIDVGDPNAAVDVERQRIRHLDVDRHLVRPGAGPTRQRHVRNAAPAAAGGQHDRDRQQADGTACDAAPLTRAHQPPPASAGSAGPAGAAPLPVRAARARSDRAERITWNDARCRTRRRPRLRVPRRRQRVVFVVGIRRPRQPAVVHPECGRRIRRHTVGSAQQLGEALGRDVPLGRTAAPRCPAYPARRPSPARGCRARTGCRARRCPARWCPCSPAAAAAAARSTRSAWAASCAVTNWLRPIGGKLNLIASRIGARYCAHSSADS